MYILYACYSWASSIFWQLGPLPKKSIYHHKYSHFVFFSFSFSVSRCNNLSKNSIGKTSRIYYSNHIMTVSFLFFFQHSERNIYEFTYYVGSRFIVLCYFLWHGRKRKKILLHNRSGHHHINCASFFFFGEFSLFGKRSVRNVENKKPCGSTTEIRIICW